MWQHERMIIWRFENYDISFSVILWCVVLSEIDRQFGKYEMKNFRTWMKWKFTIAAYDDDCDGVEEMRKWIFYS